MYPLGKGGEEASNGRFVADGASNTDAGRVRFEGRSVALPGCTTQFGKYSRPGVAMQRGVVRHRTILY